MSISKPKNRKAKTRTSLLRFDGKKSIQKSDFLATEEPLEIRLVAGKNKQTIAITMRTPGNDFELAAGFLFAEGVIGTKDEIRRIAYCTDHNEPQLYNIVNVELKGDALPELPGLDRHFFTNSACGVCGKSALENLHSRCTPLQSKLRVEAGIISSLPEKLKTAQALFGLTGGLHAAALFDSRGKLVASREDVGRHNALDKLLGWAFLENKLPLDDHLVLVSGRASYELVQKCITAGVGVLAAISAPSSLAVELAGDFNLTLIGFLRGSFNLYTAPQRIVLP